MCEEDGTDTEIGGLVLLYIMRPRDSALRKPSRMVAVLLNFFSLSGKVFSPERVPKGRYSVD